MLDYQRDGSGRLASCGVTRVTRRNDERSSPFANMWGGALRVIARSAWRGLPAGSRGGVTLLVSSPLYVRRLRLSKQSAARRARDAHCACRRRASLRWPTGTGDEPLENVVHASGVNKAIKGHVAREEADLERDPAGQHDTTPGSRIYRETHRSRDGPTGRRGERDTRGRSIARNHFSPKRPHAGSFAFRSHACPQLRTPRHVGRRRG